MPYSEKKEKSFYARIFSFNVVTCSYLYALHIFPYCINFNIAFLQYFIMLFIAIIRHTIRHNKDVYKSYIYIVGTYIIEYSSQENICVAAKSKRSNDVSDVLYKKVAFIYTRHIACWPTII